MLGWGRCAGLPLPLPWGPTGPPPHPACCPSPCTPQTHMLPLRCLPPTPTPNHCPAPTPSHTFPYLTGTPQAAHQPAAGAGAAAERSGTGAGAAYSLWQQQQRRRRRNSRPAGAGRPAGRPGCRPCAPSQCSRPPDRPCGCHLLPALVSPGREGGGLPVGTVWAAHSCPAPQLALLWLLTLLSFWLSLFLASFSIAEVVAKGVVELLPTSLAMASPQPCEGCRGRLRPPSPPPSPGPAAFPSQHHHWLTLSLSLSRTLAPSPHPNPNTAPRPSAGLTRPRLWWRARLSCAGVNAPRAPAPPAPPHPPPPPPLPTPSTTSACCCASATCCCGPTPWRPPTARVRGHTQHACTLLLGV